MRFLADKLAAIWLPKLGELGRNGAKKPCFFPQNRTIFQPVRVMV
jgi:hypothetical protein